jgi:hypothetical protein
VQGTDGLEGDKLAEFHGMPAGLLGCRGDPRSDDRDAVAGEHLVDLVRLQPAAAPGKGRGQDRGGFVGSNVIEAGHTPRGTIMPSSVLDRSRGGGYFAAFFPLAQELLERPAPDVAADETTC